MKPFEPADRVKNLPPYLFAQIDKKKAQLKAQGADIIDLGVGDPDQPTPGHIIKSLQEAAADPRYHRYPSYSGMGVFNESVARFYKRRFNVSLNPRNEVITLIGSKEGIAHLPLAVINPGDIALVPTPAYPVYSVAVSFCGGVNHFMPLVEKNGYLPDFSAIPKDIAQKAKLMFLNYPNNPTSAVASQDFFKQVVRFAKENSIIVCHDAAYTETYFDGYLPPSFLETPGAREVGIEFHSLSKTYNMTGWRIGFAVGNADIIAGLGKVKSNIDSGAFDAVQMAGITALDSDQDCVEQMRALYARRREVLVEGLKSAGFLPMSPKATFYVWTKVPKSYSSADFAELLLSKCAIVVTPGNGFGEPGEGYFRMTLCLNEERLAEAVERIRGLGL
ncbi:MAG: LL-diaminopimelate aminotransferase [Desulfatibacillaceae bacterium]|nr:LL-diaminopimelate aminotransferase [Desulfatibacillaceae bacterium]